MQNNPFLAEKMVDEKTLLEVVQPNAKYKSNNQDFSEESLGIGKIISNRYEIESLLGEGGMGAVFKAKDRNLLRSSKPYRAIKVLKAEYSRDALLLDSLFSDFERARALENCPNIIKVYDYSKDGENAYVVMEYIDGIKLTDKIRGQKMDVIHAWPIIEGIGNALNYAHKNKIIHRDIKPGNIMLTHDGIVKVLDFGVASKIKDRDDDKTVFSFGGHLLGAHDPKYSPPDMLNEEPDARDDVYSFACVVYEILTGKQYYYSEDKKNNKIYIRGLSERQSSAFNKALAVDRKNRTKTINDFIDALHPAGQNKNRYISLLGGSALILIISSLAYYFGSTPQLIEPLIVEPQLSPSSPIKLKPIEPVVSLPPESTISTPIPAPIIPDVVNPYQATKIIAQTSQDSYKNKKDNFEFSFSLDKLGYIRIFDVDVKKQITPLYPNKWQTNDIIEANVNYVLPPKNIKKPWKVNGILGSVSSVIVIASPEPFKIKQFIDKTTGQVIDEIKNGNYAWTSVEYRIE